MLGHPTGGPSATTHGEELTSYIRRLVRKNWLKKGGAEPLSRTFSLQQATTPASHSHQPARIIVLARTRSGCTVHACPLTSNGRVSSQKI